MGDDKEREGSGMDWYGRWKEVEETRRGTPGHGKGKKEKRNQTAVRRNCCNCTAAATGLVQGQGGGQGSAVLVVLELLLGAWCLLPVCFCFQRRNLEGKSRVDFGKRG